MRHFLKFIPADKRGDAEKQYSGDDEHAPSERVTEAILSRSEPARPKAPPQRAQRPDDVLDDIHRPAFKPAQQPEKSQPQLASDAAGIKERLESAAASESTGVFLSSLDNSAIALADSGMFNLEVDDDEDADAPVGGGFNPYNRG